MMKMHRSSRIRSLAGGTLVAALIAAGLGLSAPGFAQEKPGEEKVIRNVIVKRMGKDGAPLRVEGQGAAEMLRRCESGRKAESDVSTGGEKDKLRTRVIVCSRDGTQSSAELNARLAEALERARGEFGQHGDITPERQAELQAAIDREIARLRSQPRQ